MARRWAHVKARGVIIARRNTVDRRPHGGRIKIAPPEGDDPRAVAPSERSASKKLPSGGASRKLRSAARAFQIMRRHCELFTMFKVSSPSHYTRVHGHGRETRRTRRYPGPTCCTYTGRGARAHAEARSRCHRLRAHTDNSHLGQ